MLFGSNIKLKTIINYIFFNSIFSLKNRYEHTFKSHSFKTQLLLCSTLNSINFNTCIK